MQGKRLSKAQNTNFLSQIREQVSKLTNRSNVPTAFSMSVAGFKYTGEGGAARCEHCGLEISGCTTDIDPLAVHSQQKPDCSFIRSKRRPSLSDVPASVSASTTTDQRTSILHEQQIADARIKFKIIDPEYLLTNLCEVDLLQQIRIRTFSHWPHQTSRSCAQVIAAGFFMCNVGDRVICLYCNLICQQWAPNTDEPCENHKILSPECAYVKAILMRPEILPKFTGKGNLTTGTTNNQSPAVRYLGQWQQQFVPLNACHPSYAEIPQRHASFATWPAENSPSVDDLVRAGFFYTDTKTIVTCFYCNGSLQNRESNDDPMIEHARWFPDCAYAKQLCGDEMYRKIQESRCAQQERIKAIDAILNSNRSANNRPLLIPDESTLSRLVAARLDLPISQRLLAQNFKLSIIKRCWEDRLRLKQDDFATETDLYVACLIFQNQIQYINGRKENIIVPSVKMKQIREQTEALIRECESTPNTTQLASTSTPMEMTTSSQFSVESITTSATVDQNQASDQEPSNPCVLCLTEEKRLACMPCGHLAACVPCGHSLRSCPICRREIESFVRIYT